MGCIQKCKEGESCRAWGSVLEVQGGVTYFITASKTKVKSHNYSCPR